MKKCRRVAGTLRTMKFLQSACIIGAIAALSPLATWGPSNISEPVRELVRADNSVQADDAQASDTVLNAVPIDANAVAPSSPFLLTLANRMPMSSSAKTPSATSRRTVAASAEVLPKQFLTALAAANSKPVGAPPPTRLAYAVVPDLTPDPEAHSPSPRNSETPDFSILVDYTYSEVPPPEAPADTVLRALKEIPEGTPREEVRRAAQTFGLDVTFMEAVAKIESDFDPKQRTGSYIGLFQLSKYEFDRYGSGEITDGRDNAIAGAYKFAVAAILFELADAQEGNAGRPLFDPSAGHPRRRRARRASRPDHLGIDVRHRRGQGKRRALVQARDLAEHAAGGKKGLGVG